MSCSLVEIERHFRGTYCLHHQAVDDRGSKYLYITAPTSKHFPNLVQRHLTKINIWIRWGYSNNRIQISLYFINCNFGVFLIFPFWKEAHCLWENDSACFYQCFDRMCFKRTIGGIGKEQRSEGGRNQRGV